MTNVEVFHPRRVEAARTRLSLPNSMKVTLEIEAPATGCVVEFCVEPDSEVRVGSVVLVLDAERNEPQ